MRAGSWYGIVAAATEGVAPQKPPTGEEQSPENAILADCLDGILGAGRGKTAGRRQQRGEIAFICAQQVD